MVPGAHAQTASAQLPYTGSPPRAAQASPLRLHEPCAPSTAPLMRHRQVVIEACSTSPAPSAQPQAEQVCCPRSKGLPKLYCTPQAPRQASLTPPPKPRPGNRAQGRKRAQSPAGGPMQLCHASLGLRAPGGARWHAATGNVLFSTDSTHPAPPVLAPGPSQLRARRARPEVAMATGPPGFPDSGSRAGAAHSRRRTAQLGGERPGPQAQPRRAVQGMRSGPGAAGPHSGYMSRRFSVTAPAAGPPPPATH